MSRRPPVEADPHRCGIRPGPRKTTTVPKILRVGRKGRPRPSTWDADKMRLRRGA